MSSSTLLKVSRHVSHVSHVGVKLSTVRPEPREVAPHAPVSDGAGGQPDLIGDLIERHRHAAIPFGQEGDSPEGHGATIHV